MLVHPHIPRDADSRIGTDPAKLPPMRVPWQFDYTDPVTYRLAVRLYLEDVSSRMQQLREAGERADSFTLLQLLLADSQSLVTPVTEGKKEEDGGDTELHQDRAE